MRVCDRCETNPVSGTRGDFQFCKDCLPVIEGQVALNEATVHLTAAQTALQKAQERLDGKS